MRATATATPIRTAVAAEVKAKAPAAPEANARAMSINPTLVRDDISRKEGSTGSMSPRAKDIIMAMKIPNEMVFRALFASCRSPRAVAKDRETLGVSMGAITIAPIITATLLLITPIAATIEESTIIDM